MLDKLDKLDSIDKLDIDVVEVDRDVSIENMIHKTSGFALAKFEKSMSLLQQRMFAAALSQVDKSLGY